MREVDVKGYAGIYTIAEDGSIYSVLRSEFSRNRHGPMIRRRGDHPLKSFIGNKGYWMVELNNKNKPKKFYIHRMVYESFNGELVKGMIVHHLDENKKNNHHSNLVQITHKHHSDIHKLLKAVKE